MIIHNVKQNTPEWQGIRAGKITGSGVGAIMTSGRGEMFGKTAKGYMEEKVAEMLTGIVCSKLDTAATRWGHENEPAAIERFQYETLIKVDSIGFCEVNEDMGCSPDGIVSDGIIEVKCPYNEVNHFRTLKERKVPSVYVPQVQFNMWCMNVTKCWFISYDPRFQKKENQVVFFQVELDVEYVTKMLERIDIAVEMIKNSYKEWC